MSTSTKGIFTLDLNSFKSALISTLLMAVLGVLVYIVSIGDVFAIEWKLLLNVGVMSLATGLISLIKSLLTTDNGKFMGSVDIQ